MPTFQLCYQADATITGYVNVEADDMKAAWAMRDKLDTHIQWDDEFQNVYDCQAVNVSMLDVLWRIYDRPFKSKNHPVTATKTSIADVLCFIASEYDVTKGAKPVEVTELTLCYVQESKDLLVVHPRLGGFYVEHTLFEVDYRHVEDMDDDWNL